MPILAICYASAMDQLVCHVLKDLTFRQMAPHLQMELVHAQEDFIVKTMHACFVLMDATLVFHQQIV